jgi:predicted metal-dependent hydrolase
MSPRCTLFTLKGPSILGIAGCLMVACSSQQVQEKVQPGERALQPTVSAFECGGGRMKSTIESCRAEGGHYGRCAVLASRAGVSRATECYNYASTIHKRREQLVGQEDQLDAEIRYLQDVNRDTEGLNRELSGRIEEATARVDTGVESLAQGEMAQSELTQLHAILDNEVSFAQRQLDAASSELQAAEQYRERQPAPTRAALDAQIARLQALLDEARRQTTALVAQRERI